MSRRRALSVSNRPDWGQPSPTRAPLGWASPQLELALASFPSSVPHLPTLLVRLITPLAVRYSPTHLHDHPTAFPVLERPHLDDFCFDRFSRRVMWSREEMSRVQQ